MYRRRRNTSLSSAGRKVQFVESGLSATGTSFHVPQKENGLQKGATGVTKLTPLHSSPAPPLLDSPPQEDSDDISLPSISDRKVALGSNSAPWAPEKRFSVTMPKEKKAELLSALKEQRLPQSDRKHSLSGSRQSLSLPQDRASFSFSIDGSCSRDTDDFVDNLTRQKMNLQLKSITERMFEVKIIL